MNRTSIKQMSALAVVAWLVIVAMAAPPVAAQSETDPAFIVELHADGSAAVSVRSTFDLTSDSEQAAFQTLTDDEEARQEATGRFRNRMRAVASDAANATGRAMEVTGASIDLQRSADGKIGIVTLSVTWEGLAAVEDDTLVVTEPFASGFTTDRPFVLDAPEGYQLVSATPEPASTDATRATWNAGTDLSGFTAEFQAEATTSPTDAPDGGGAQTDGQPGFGGLAALLAVTIAAAVVTLRRMGRRD